MCYGYSYRGPRGRYSDRLIFDLPKYRGEQHRKDEIGAQVQKLTAVPPYVADVQFHTQREYPQFPAAVREDLAMHAFLRGLALESLGQHVHLTRPLTLGSALDQAERAEVTQTAAFHGRGLPAVSCGTITVAFQSGQAKDRVRKPRPPDLELQQCRKLGLGEDCGWTGQRVIHPRPSRRRGRRQARRQRVVEDGVPEWHSNALLRRNPRWRLSPITPEGSCGLLGWAEESLCRLLLETSVSDCTARQPPAGAKTAAPATGTLWTV